MTTHTSGSGAQSPAPLSVDVWLDIACPWCALGERRLIQVLDGFPADVQLRFRSYQIAPDAPERASMKQPEFLASRGMDMNRFRQAQQQLVDAGAELDFHFKQDDTIPSNTHTAHRLIQAAGAADRASAAGKAGLQTAVVGALFSAYFERGKDLGDHQVLREVATGAGMEAATVDRVLAEPSAFANDVAEDIAEAARLGIRGVPFTVIGGRFGLSGAQPEASIREALAQAQAALTEEATERA